MTSEEMQPGVEPPGAPGPPLRGARALQTPSSTRVRTSVRQPTGRPQQPLPAKANLPRPSPSSIPATRVATQVRRPVPSARKPAERSAVPAGAFRPQSRSTRPVPSTKSKPLLPITERRAFEPKPPVTRPRTTSDAEKWDIAPDGHSAGREGRQFAVANVGNNGRIYLRYVCFCSYPTFVQLSFGSSLVLLPRGTANWY